MRSSCCYAMPTCRMGMNNYGGGSCCCNFPALVILILILLQFGKGKVHIDSSSDETSESAVGKFGFGIDNGILFIIALYYLSCCNPCRR